MPEVTALCAGVLVKAAGGHITLELLTKPQGNLRFRRVLDAETSPCEEGIDRRGYFPAVFVFMEDWTMVVFLQEVLGAAPDLWLHNSLYLLLEIALFLRRGSCGSVCQSCLSLLLTGRSDFLIHSGNLET